MDLNALLSAGVTGLALGSMYGLTALGFYITYAVSGTVNFAQGATLMLGAVLLFTFGVKFGWPLAAAVPLSLLLCAAWSVLVECIGVRPFVRRGSDAWLMATVALGLILENVVLFAFGKDPRGLPSSVLTTSGIEFAGLRITLLQALIPLTGFGIAAALTLFMQRTAAGKALSAIAQNRDAARLMGIDVGFAITAAFAVAGVFAGIAGMLIAPLYTISAGMGTLFGIKAFAAAILGGIGNPWGVMLAGVLLGFAESLITASLGSTWTQMLSFAIVIAALAWRPYGVFGRAALKKV
jgi:branched-chain amino acid transport system permease protein